MTNYEFVLWLWGFLELCEAQPINRKMLFIIRNHLNLVRAVDGCLGDFNQTIDARVLAELDMPDQSTTQLFFDVLRQDVQQRLIERQTEQAA